MRTTGLLLAAILFPVVIHAAALVNINVADAALLDTLPGIGPSKAVAIVEYRTQHGSFVQIEDIQNVSGIGPSTFANIKSLITVGDTGTQTSNTSSVTSTATSTESVSAVGSVSAYTPPPSDISVTAGPDVTAITEAPFTFTATTKTKSGALDPSANVHWSFGDGSSAEGSAVDKVYHYSGTYLVTVTATDGSAVARDETVATVRPAAVRITEISCDGIVLANDAEDILDLSGWSLSSGINSFRIPKGTMLLPNAKTLFPSAISNLPSTPNAFLMYPTGMVAARYAPPVVALATTTEPAGGGSASDGQPSSSVTGYTEVQAVEPIISTKADAQSHEDGVKAPAVPTQPVGVAGAALPSATSAPSPSLFKSPWTLGFIGTVLLAGGAFIFI